MNGATEPELAALLVDGPIDDASLDELAGLLELDEVALGVTALDTVPPTFEFSIKTNGSAQY